MRIRDALGAEIPEELRVAAETSFTEIQKYFSRREWKGAGLDSGHFAEAILRILDFLLFRSYRPIGKSLPRFDEKRLQSFASAHGDESLRVLIPRQLWALYALRNKRSIGHLGLVPAREIDATILLYGAKWVLSELIRLTTDLDEPKAQQILDRVIATQTAAVWREGEIVRVLKPQISAREKAVLILAFVGPYDEATLRAKVEYKNNSDFRKILRKLHKDGLVHFENGECRITPPGVDLADEIRERFELKL